jgi:hypothetical protein
MTFKAQMPQNSTVSLVLIALQSESSKVPTIHVYSFGNLVSLEKKNR